MRTTNGGVITIASKLDIPSLGIGHYQIEGVTYSAIRVKILDWKDKFAKFQDQGDWKAFYYSKTGQLPSSYSHIEVVADMSNFMFYLIQVNHSVDEKRG